MKRLLKIIDDDLDILNRIKDEAAVLRESRTLVVKNAGESIIWYAKNRIMALEMIKEAIETLEGALG